MGCPFNRHFRMIEAHLKVADTIAARNEIAKMTEGRGVTLEAQLHADLFMAIVYLEALKIPKAVTLLKSLLKKTELSRCWHLKVEAKLHLIAAYFKNGSFKEIKPELDEVRESLMERAKKLDVSLNKINEVENNRLLKYLVAMYYNFLGLYLHEESKIDEAREYFFTAMSILENIGDKNHKASCLNNLGRTYMQKGDINTALEYYMRAVDMFEAIGNKSRAHVVMYNVGTLYYLNGDLENALLWYHKSEKMATELNADQNKLLILNGIGAVYLKRGELDKAFNYFKECLKISLKKENKSFIASSYHNLGEIQFRRGYWSTAELLYKKAEKIWKEQQNKELLSHCYHNLGSLYNNQLLYEKALKYYQIALKLRKEIGNPFLIAETLYSIILLYLENKSIEMTEKYLNELQNLKEKWPHELIEIFYQEALAVYLKYKAPLELKSGTGLESLNKALQCLVDAKKMLKLLIGKANRMDYLLIQNALFMLMDILILELKTLQTDKKDNKILKELEMAINQFDILLKDQSLPDAAKIYYLKSKFELLRKNLNNADIYMQKAHRIASTCGYRLLERAIQSELRKIDQYSKNQHLMSTSSDDLIEMVDFEMLISSLSQNRFDYYLKYVTNEITVKALTYTEFSSFIKELRHSYPQL